MSVVLRAVNKAGPYIGMKFGCTIMKNGCPPTIFGSGTFVRKDGRLFVATAGHVLERISYNDDFVVYWGGGNLDIIAYRQNVNDSADSDVAAVELPDPPKGTEDLGVEFPTPCAIEDADRYAVVCGVTRSRVREDPVNEQLHIEWWSQGLCPLPREKWPSTAQSADTRSKLFYEYSGEYAFDANGNRMPALDPHGLSGGGIWSMELTEHSEFNPDSAKLIGIQYRAEEKAYNFLLANRIEKWLELFKSS